jgi:medium-chain acyl-[acyl-carrier-protein] hydrolase
MDLNSRDTDRPANERPGGAKRATNWTNGSQAPSTPGVTLFCFPHAGGGASAYRGWASALAPRVAVRLPQLPGRESRFREPPLTELDDVLADLYRIVAPETEQPFAFLGHSMGAVVAYELARLLRREIGRSPVHLFVSACRAPGRPQLSGPCSTLPRPEFVAEVMRRYGGIPAAILADEDYMAAILPAMRADFGILERYRMTERPKLDCPISAFGGWDDTATPLPALEDWKLHTTGAFDLEMLDGGHFYLQQKRGAMVTKILSALALTESVPL